MLSHIVAIVTGGSSGLGAATVRTLVRNGARVCVADLATQESIYNEWSQQLDTSSCTNQINSFGSSKTDDIAVSTIRSTTSRLTYATTDVTDTNQICHTLDHIERTFGEPVNTAINCAGIAIAKKTLSKKGPHPLEDFTRSVMVNMVGTFNVNRLAAERMSSRDLDSFGLRGCIINTASIAAYEGQIGQVAYAASKGGIVGMTLPMARDLSGYGIRVMTIAPGLFETPLLDNLPQAVKDQLGSTVPCPSRLGKPEEFAQLVVSIIENKMLNGSVIRLDGALRMTP